MTLNCLSYITYGQKSTSSDQICGLEFNFSAECISDESSDYINISVNITKKDIDTIPPYIIVQIELIDNNDLIIKPFENDAIMTTDSIVFSIPRPKCTSNPNIYLDIKTISARLALPCDGDIGGSCSGGSESGSGCECQLNWNLSDCIDATITPCYVNDGKLPDGAFPSSLNVKVSKQIYINNQLYEYDSDTGSWISDTDTLIIQNGLFSFSYDNTQFTIAPAARYREFYDDYTLAENYTNECYCKFYQDGTFLRPDWVGPTTWPRFLRASGFPESSNINGIYQESYCNGVISPHDAGYSVPYAKVDGQVYISNYDGDWAIYDCTGIGPAGSCTYGNAVSNTLDEGVLPPNSNWFMNDGGPGGNPPPTAGGTLEPYELSISFGSTCRMPNPSSDCTSCINSPSIEYSTLPNYGPYYDGCTGRPIDIDVDACNGTVHPTSFSKPNFVLYYTGGIDKPFLIIDDIAYDPRSITGLIKVFSTGTAEEMRNLVCTRLRFATLIDETKLESNINEALSSNWPYNDLYWYSECENLPNETPINIIPC